MIRNYFKTAIRSLRHNKAFSIINVLGLSIGISAALVIFLIAYYEFSYDRFEKDGERIYRVVLDAKFNGTEGHSPAVPAPLGAAIENEVTGVEQTVPVFQFQGDGTAKVSITKAGRNKPVVFKNQADIVFTNDKYFDILPFHWITGSAKTALQNPFSVVLTHSRAKLYFPSLTEAEVIGKQLTYNDELTATVSGIVKDLNDQTVFNAVEFISLPTIAKTNLQERFMMTVWNDWMAYSQLYIKLSKGTTPAQTEAQLKALLKKYNKDANKDENNTMSFHLQPLSDIHFNNLYQGVGQRIAHKPTLYGLFAVAGFLLLLGCINFINLTTAKAAQRAKEIGIRKTMGSSRKQLILQFLGETFFITVVATILSAAFTPVLLRLFANFIPPGLKFDLLHQPSIFLFLGLLTVVVSFLSGLYPALILSGYKPVSVLKNQPFLNTGKTRHAWVRKTLTVSQFVIAQFFIIAAIMVSKQINYSLHTDMGFKKEAVLNFNTPGSPKDTIAVTKTAVLMNQLRAIPGVALASQGFLSPATQGSAFGNITYTDEKKQVKENVQVRWGDENYLDVYQIKLVAGRNVASNDSTHECLVNETYAKMIGFTNSADALNKQIEWGKDKYTITGVMHDFHQHSTHSLIDPVAFRYGKGGFIHIALQPQTSEWNKTINAIQKAYKALYPDEDFTYTFFDETIAKMYESELRTASLLKWATGLTIFISCLGLLGLVMFTIHTRTKEIGIRKILGASVANIISVLSIDFMLLVFIAFIIATPLGWWASYTWLEDLAYRTPMSWWVFIISGAVMLLTALITLSLQTIKAATAKPVKNLRTE